MNAPRHTSTLIARVPDGVEHGLEREPNLYTGGDVAHMHAKPMPVGVEESVRVEQCCDA